MSKEGEKNYLKKIGNDSVNHAINKPFSDSDCSRYLLEMGIIMSLLPKSPKKILDLGCGTGWTSIFLAKCGYEVTGQDISADMIEYANQNKNRENLANLHFIVSDYEELTFLEEFDGAIFYDSLHHSMNEDAALSSAYNALKPGGICITVEPGKGHGEAEYSLHAIKKFDVTEKDMDPDTIIQSGKKAGFNSFQVYPHIRDIREIFYKKKVLNRTHLLEIVSESELLTNYEKNNGIVVLMKNVDVLSDNELDSAVISDTIPPVMKRGVSYDVSMVIRNTGNCSWNHKKLIRLGALGDCDSDAFKLGVVRIDIPENIVIKPGDCFEFNFPLKSSAEKGEHHLKFQMVWEFQTWFGMIFSKSVMVV